MGQDNLPKPSVLHLRQEGCRLVIGQVPKGARDPSLHGGGIGALLQEAAVMVRLQDKAIYTRESSHKVYCDRPDVNRYPDLRPFKGNEKAHRLARVVGDRKSVHLKGPEGEGVPRAEEHPVTGISSPICGEALGRPGIHVEWGAVTLGKRDSPTDVIPMLMAEKDGLKVLGSGTDRVEPAFDLTGREPSVHKETIPPRLTVKGVSGAAASQEDQPNRPPPSGRPPADP